MTDLLVVEDVPWEISSAWAHWLAGIPGSDTPIHVTSVASMVNQVWLRVTGGQPPHGFGTLQRLFISGHGSPGEQSVGIGDKTDPTGTKCLRTAPGGTILRGGATALLAMWAPLFAPNAVVTLGGCEVADTIKGNQLLLALSAAMGGVAVQGGTGKQVTCVPWLRGSVKRACRGAVVNLGSSSWDIPGPAAPPVQPGAMLHTDGIAPAR
jgi:hypothetical protein